MSYSITTDSMQFACLDCRKTVKRPRSKMPEHGFLCPFCHKPMQQMGKAFRSPKQTDLEQWKKVRLLVQAGVTFYPGGGAKPAFAKDVVAFLEATRAKTEGELYLERMQQIASKTPPRDQGRLKRLSTVGALRFTLAGQELLPWTQVLIRVNHQWLEGTFRITGDGGRLVQPHVQINEVIHSGQRRIFIKPNTVLRFPRVGL